MNKVLCRVLHGAIFSGEKNDNKTAVTPPHFRVPPLEWSGCGSTFHESCLVFKAVCRGFPIDSSVKRVAAIAWCYYRYEGAFGTGRPDVIE